MEMKHLVVTIEREYGNKGAEIGKKLAEALSVGHTFLSNKLIEAQSSMIANVAEKLVEKVDKKRRDYYLHVTGRKRNELHDRQFMFDSNILGIDGTVEGLKNIIIKLHGKKAWHFLYLHFW